MEDLISSFKSLIDEEKFRDNFSFISEDEVPIWEGKPTFSSYFPQYCLAFFVFLIHFCFYRVAVTVYAEGQSGYLNTAIRIIGQLFDLIDVFAFVVVMIIFARINYFLNFSTSTTKTSLFLVFIGLIPSVWFIINIIDWFLLLIGREALNVPEWFDTWFLALGIINGLIIFSFSIISQFSYSYIMTDKNLYIQRRKLIFYKSHTSIAFEDLENLITQQSIVGKLIGIGNILPILEINSDIPPKANDERNLIQKSAHIIKLLIFYKRSSKEIILPPSECFFGIKQPMVVYELANELIDMKNGRPDLLVEND